MLVFAGEQRWRQVEFQLKVTFKSLVQFAFELGVRMKTPNFVLVLIGEQAKVNPGDRAVPEFDGFAVSKNVSGFPATPVAHRIPPASTAPLKALNSLSRNTSVSSVSSSRMRVSGLSEP